MAADVCDKGVMVVITNGHCAFRNFRYGGHHARKSAKPRPAYEVEVSLRNDGGRRAFKL